MAKSKSKKFLEFLNKIDEASIIASEKILEGVEVVEEQVQYANQLAQDLAAAGGEGDIVDTIIERDERRWNRRYETHKNAAKQLDKEYKALEKEDKNGRTTFVVESEEGDIILDETTTKVEIQDKVEVIDGDEVTVSKIYEKKGDKLYVSERRVSSDGKETLHRTKIKRTEKGYKTTKREIDTSTGQKSYKKEKYEKKGDSIRYTTKNRDNQGRKNFHHEMLNRKNNAFVSFDRNKDEHGRKFFSQKTTNQTKTGAISTSRYQDAIGRKAVVSSEFKRISNREYFTTKAKDFDGSKTSIANRVRYEGNRRVVTREIKDKYGVKTRQTISGDARQATKITNQVTLQTLSKADLQKSRIQKSVLQNNRITRAINNRRFKDSNFKAMKKSDFATFNKNDPFYKKMIKPKSWFKSDKDKEKVNRFAPTVLKRGVLSNESIHKNLKHEFFASGEARRDHRRQVRKQQRQGKGLITNYAQRGMRHQLAKDSANYSALKRSIANKEKNKLWKSVEERNSYHAKLRESRVQLMKSTKRMENSNKAIARRAWIKQKARMSYRWSKKSVLSGMEQDSENLLGAGTSGITGGILSWANSKINPWELLKRQLIKIVMSAASSLLGSLGIYIVPAFMIVIIVCAVINGGSSSGGGGGSGTAIQEDLKNNPPHTAEKYQNWPDNKKLEDTDVEALVKERGDLSEQQIKLLRFLFAKVGYPYSQDSDKRMSGSYYDCSSLAYSAEKEAEQDIGNLTAADQAKKLVEDRKVLSVNDKEEGKDLLQVGDLVYYGGKNNGRFNGIHHVAIYVGNGYVVEAYDEARGVVYQPLRIKDDEPMWYCRPTLGQEKEEQSAEIKVYKNSSMMKSAGTNVHEGVARKESRLCQI